MSIPAYQLDQSGYFVAATVADESQQEPGVYHFPFGCIEHAPPEHVEGQRRRFVNGNWAYEDLPMITPEVPPAPVAPAPQTMAQAVATKLAEINARCELELRVVNNGYPDAEVQSWPKQETEARAYVADPSVKTPLLSALCSARGVLLDDIVGKVIEKADAFAVLTGSAIGKRQACEDILQAMVADPDSTIEGVATVAWPDPISDELIPGE